MAEQPTLWVLERLARGRLRYRLTIRRGERLLLALRAADRWPGSGATVFCLREAPGAEPEVVEELERVPVISLNRRGKRLSVVLDRRRRRRCELLFLTKQESTRDGSFEQIYWQTQQSVRQRRRRSGLTGEPGVAPLDVVVDAGQRYAWQLPGCLSHRERLPVGDYALLLGGSPAAVVARTTFADLLRDLSDLRALHHRLDGLAARPAAALVVEAAYADFLRPEAVRPLDVDYVARALADVTVLHPALRVVWAGTRKVAVQWTAAYFHAVARQAGDHAEPAVQEPLGFYGAAGVEVLGLERRVELAVLHEMPDSFPIAALRRRFPEADDATLRRVLDRVRDRGELVCHGRGLAARWERSVG